MFEWREFVETDQVKIVMRHATTSLAVIAIFLIVGFFLRQFDQNWWVTKALIGLDEFALVGTFAWFVYQMGVRFWNTRERIGGSGLCAVW